MRALRSGLLAATVLLTTVVAPSAGAQPAAPPAFDPAPAAAALHRLIGDKAEQVRLVPVDGQGADRSTVSGGTGELTIEGTSPATMLAGFGDYLRKIGAGEVSPTDTRIDLPAELPAPPGPITRTANVAHRFAGNDTNDGYTRPYGDWKYWQREIDMFALHGVNEVLVYAGQDAAYYDTFRRFGYSDTELRDWIPTPAHQPWWLLQNMCCDVARIPGNVLGQHAELGRKITDRLRSLGMTPVLPGYFGTVPDDFPERNPGARVIPQGTWNGDLRRPDWLDPRNPYFDKVAAAFYAAQRRLFGDSTMYKMDLLHEGGKPGDVPVPEAAKQVQSALDAAHPNAIWAILGWQDNPTPELLSGVDKDRMLIMDGLSDSKGIPDRETHWKNTPYAFGTIYNFGGKTTLGAETSVWNERYWRWKNKPGSTLSGIAVMPEAMDNNPAAFGFLTDLAWRPEPPDRLAWFRDWVDNRYGAQDPHARAAWRLLAESAYAMPADGPMGPEENGPGLPHDGMFAAQPDLSATGSGHAPEYFRYEPGPLREALRELLAVHPRVRATDAYRHDVVDLARQVLSDDSRFELPKLKAAYQARDLPAFRRLAGQWLHRMDLLDKVTGTDRRFMLGHWLADTRAWAADAGQAKLLARDARTLLGPWSERTKDLHNYANREWSGLVSGLYTVRWQAYFTELSDALAEHREPRPIDFIAMNNAWARRDAPLPSTPSGDPHAAARAALDSVGTDG